MVRLVGARGRQWSSLRHARGRGTTWLALVVASGSAVFLLAGMLPERAPDDTSALAPGSAAAHVVTFDEELLADVAAYRAPRRTAMLMVLVTAVAVPAGFAFALGSSRARWLLAAVRLLPGTPLQTGAAAAVVVGVTAFAALPARVWMGVVQDGQYGFRTQSVLGWLSDMVLRVGGRAILVGGLVACITLMMSRHPRDWPARVTLLSVVAGVTAVFLHPLVVHPFLLPTAPMPAGEHLDAVRVIIDRSDVDVPVLLGEASSRTTRRNAVATGLGRTERIVIYDTLLAAEPPVVAAIVAHEVAHIERRDPLRAALAPVPFVALGSLVLQRRLRARDGQDVRVLAAAAAFALAVVAAGTPLSAAMSRTVELRTDARSVVLSGDPAAHVSLLESFVVEGLADPDPPRWSVVLWATHPSPLKRMETVSEVAGLATR